MPPCLTLSIIKYRSRVKWNNQEKVSHLHFGVVANETGAFKSPSITVANFTLILITATAVKLLDFYSNVRLMKLVTSYSIFSGAI